MKTIFVLYFCLYFQYHKMIINTPQEMINLGKQLAKKYKKILLYGDLGAGKTSLTKGFAQWLWIESNLVQSPTYTYINTYDNKLIHLDLYRLENIQDLIEKWIQDQLEDFDFVVIERPKFENYLDLGAYTKITIEKDWDKRIVNILG